MSETMKACTRCKTVKSLEDFYVNRKAKDGRQSSCKSCTKAYGAKWYAENRERLLDYHAKYRAENREHRTAYGAKWRADNPEYNAQYRADNPHAYWEANYRSRARALGFDPVVRSFTRDDMIAYWGNGEKCIYCDAPFTEIEHLIPVGLGGIHAVENVAPSCGPCNRQNIDTVRRERRAMAAA